MAAHDLDNLKSLLTPALFTHIAEAQLPYSKTSPLDFADVVAEMGTDHFAAALRDSNAWPALVALSRLGLDGVPDLMSFLPDPSAREFPRQCHGLQLLLDQGPRVLCSGVDDRWTSGYFGVLALRLAGQWRALPPAQRPDSWARWRDDAGVTCIDHWAVSRLTWAAPFLHAEDLGSQEIGLAMSEETRAAVEAHAGVADPRRADRTALLEDDHAFLREIIKGPPRGEGLNLASWTFWWCMILDAHWPIINKFGRYPYRNAILGRESTREEEIWLDEENHFAEAPPDVAKRIKEDVAKDVWTPLGEGSGSSSS